MSCLSGQNLINLYSEFPNKLLSSVENSNGAQHSTEHHEAIEAGLVVVLMLPILTELAHVERKSIMAVPPGCATPVSLYPIIELDVGKSLVS